MRARVCVCSLVNRVNNACMQCIMIPNVIIVYSSAIILTIIMSL